MLPSPGKVRCEVGSTQKVPAEQAFMAQAVAMCVTHLSRIFHVITIKVVSLEECRWKVLLQ